MAVGVRSPGLGDRTGPVNPPPQRIMVTIMDHIGDVVNTTSVLAALRRAFPAAWIVGEMCAGSEPLLEGLGLVDTIWSRRRGVGGRVERLTRMRHGRIDLALLLDCDNAAVVLAWLAGIPVRYGVHKNRYGRLYTGSVSRRDDEHETLGPFRRLMPLLGVETAEWRTMAHEAPGSADRVCRTLGAAGWHQSRPLVGLVVGASGASRVWPAERFGELCGHLERLGYAPVLLGSEVDRPRAAQVLASAPEALSLIGAPLADLPAALRLCRAVVSGDTGPMHLVAALGVPCVALYGPSRPEQTGPLDRSRCTLVTSATGAMDGIAAAHVAAALDALAGVCSSMDHNLEAAHRSAGPAAGPETP